MKNIFSKLRSILLLLTIVSITTYAETIATDSTAIKLDKEVVKADTTQKKEDVKPEKKESDSATVVTSHKVDSTKTDSLVNSTSVDSTKSAETTDSTTVAAVVIDSVVTDTIHPYLTDSSISKMFISAEELQKIIPIDSAVHVGDSANNDDFYYYKGTSKLCPSDMIFVEDSVFSFSFLGKKFFKTQVSVCVDRFEFPNIRDRYPVTDVTKFEAEEQCKSRGKRLCSDLEWVSTCKNGKKGNFYPYGDSLSIYKCNTHGRSMERTGNYRDCHTDNGAFDMVGNVAEWTAGGGVGMYGGSYEDQTKSSCELWVSKKFKYKDKAVGFRCCKDPSGKE